VDVTAAHTGAESYKEKELKAIQARQVAATFSSSLALPDPGLTDPSPTLLERCATKNEKYCRLVQVARKQALEQKRQAVPTFHTFAISDYGELSPAAKEMIDWLVSCYWAKCSRESRTDGTSTLSLVRDYRYRLRLCLQLALAAGCGEMLCNRVGGKNVFFMVKHENEKCFFYGKKCCQKCSKMSKMSGFWPKVRPNHAKIP